MKSKHLQARIDQCLRNAELSTCPRRKFGAMLLDPHTNSIIADGYNGPARGEDGGFCAGHFCERNGYRPEDVEVTNADTIVRVLGKPLESPEGRVLTFIPTTARAKRLELLEANPPIASGTRMEKGCHHAESNAIANACRRGVRTEGAWMIVTGEPCEMCAKLIHHCGVTRVFVVKGGYAGGMAGTDYLTKYGVGVVFVDGPQDPRLEGRSPT